MNDLLMTDKQGKTGHDPEITLLWCARFIMVQKSPSLF